MKKIWLIYLHNGTYLHNIAYTSYAKAKKSVLEMIRQHQGTNVKHEASSWTFKIGNSKQELSIRWIKVV